MIEIQEVTKQFRDKKTFVTALKHVTFTVEKGEVVGLLGENGAGKTTLLRNHCNTINTDGRQCYCFWF